MKVVRAVGSLLVMVDAMKVVRAVGTEVVMVEVLEVEYCEVMFEELEVEDWLENLLASMKYKVK